MFGLSTELKAKGNMSTVKSMVAWKTRLKLLVE